MGCSSPRNTNDEISVKETLELFFERQDSWAQAGYESSKMTPLLELVTGQFITLIEQDAIWYQESGIKQVGFTRIVDISVESETSEESACRVTIDSSNTSFIDTSGSVPRTPEDHQTLEISLIKETTWAISSIDVTDEG